MVGGADRAKPGSGSEDFYRRLYEKHLRDPWRLIAQSRSGAQSKTRFDSAPPEFKDIPVGTWFQSTPNPCSNMRCRLWTAKSGYGGKEVRYLEAGEVVGPATRPPE